MLKHFMIYRLKILSRSFNIFNKITVGENHIVLNGAADFYPENLLTVLLMMQSL